VVVVMAVEEFERLKHFEADQTKQEGADDGARSPKEEFG
jgi:hypothetical protein